jgi:hypothetical protein
VSKEELQRGKVREDVELVVTCSEREYGGWEKYA